MHFLCNEITWDDIVSHDYWYRYQLQILDKNSKMLYIPFKLFITRIKFISIDCFFLRKKRVHYWTLLFAAIYVENFCPNVQKKPKFEINLMLFSVYLNSNHVQFLVSFRGGKVQHW